MSRTISTKTADGHNVNIDILDIKMSLRVSVMDDEDITQEDSVAFMELIGNIDKVDLNNDTFMDILKNDPVIHSYMASVKGLSKPQVSEAL